MNKQMMWGLVIVALIVGILCGYFYEKSKASNEMMMSESTMQKQVQDLQMKNEQLMKDQTMGNGKMMPTAAPSGMMMHTTAAPSGMMMHSSITPSGAMMKK
jgi:hypothetical protein